MYILETRNALSDPDRPVHSIPEFLQGIKSIKALIELFS